MGAERLIGAEREGEKIAVEIKSFLGLSTLYEFYEALDQFNFYQYTLSKKMPDRALYLAVPSDIYKEFFSEDYIKGVISHFRVSIIVYSITSESIELWIKEKSIK